MEFDHKPDRKDLLRDAITADAAQDVEEALEEALEEAGEDAAAEERRVEVKVEELVKSGVFEHWADLAPQHPHERESSNDVELEGYDKDLLPDSAMEPGAMSDRPDATDDYLGPNQARKPREEPDEGEPPPDDDDNNDDERARGEAGKEEEEERARRRKDVPDFSFYTE